MFDLKLDCLKKINWSLSVLEIENDAKYPKQKSKNRQKLLSQGSSILKDGYTSTPSIIGESVLEYIDTSKY